MNRWDTFTLHLERNRNQLYFYILTAHAGILLVLVPVTKRISYLTLVCGLMKNCHTSYNWNDTVSTYKTHSPMSNEEDICSLSPTDFQSPSRPDKLHRKWHCVWLWSVCLPFTQRELEEERQRQFPARRWPTHFSTGVMCSPFSTQCESLPHILQFCLGVPGEVYSWRRCIIEECYAFIKFLKISGFNLSVLT